MIALIADLLENVRVALGGLVVNKMRSALTMLGVIIGVGAVIALMSIGEGAQASITEQISSIGTNLLIVMPGSFSRGGVQHASGSAATLTFDPVSGKLGYICNCLCLAEDFQNKHRLNSYLSNVLGQPRAVLRRAINLHRCISAVVHPVVVEQLVERPVIPQ